jgi:hypothetical protein
MVRSILTSVLTLCLMGMGAAGELLAQDAASWVVPRTPDGRPDLQGNWSNATMTPIVRPNGVGPVLTAEQVATLEDGRRLFIEEEAQASNPDREAPPVGGEFSGDPLLDGASGGTGGYNYFWIDGGDRIAVYGGEPRSSLITHPADGQRPPLNDEGQQAVAERRAFTARFGAYDNPENRPLAERCLMSFGSNGGPPMLPNYFYNNNYTIVQTPDHVMIFTEMVHDVRIIRMGEPKPLPAHIRPWMGDSWGRWEGDTLVVETTNIHPDQALASISAAQFYPSEKIKVTERFTRTDENTINYAFTVDDPGMFSESWGGEVPFERMDGLLYEYACHEGNYALSNVLSGARAQEREGRQNQPDQR